MSVARWLAAAALLLLLVVSAALVVVRDHAAAEHTRSFRDEDQAARALLVALRTPPATPARQAALDEAKKLLGDRAAWVTVHDDGAHRTLPIAKWTELTTAMDDDAVLQVDVAIAAPAAVSLMGPFALGVDPGLDGVTLQSGDVVLPGVLLARGLSRGKLAQYVLAEGATLGVRTYALVETRIDDTRAPKRLLLGALLPEPIVDDARLLHAASLGGAYLAAHTKRDGRYEYEMDAATGKASGGYNAVRHAGTTYALLQLHRQRALRAPAPAGVVAPADVVAPALAPALAPAPADVIDPAALDASVIAAADQGLAWLLDKTITDPSDPSRAFQLDGKKVKLGGGALTLMAFVERLHITTPRPHADVETKAAQLARYLLSQQNDEGRFASYYAPSAAYEADARDSIYYPGEAVLALARYAALLTKRGQDGAAYRAAAEKGARFLIDERHSALGVRVRMPVDAWLLLAIELLDRSAGANGYGAEDTLLVHADRIASQIMREQYVEDRVPLPMRGARADTDFGSLVSTGSRMEALAAASAIEKRHAPSEHRARRAAIANAAYGMRFQFNEERMFLTSPSARALGGVPNSVTDPRIRIDGVQHNMSGWLLLGAVLAGRELP